MRWCHLAVSGGHGTSRPQSVLVLPEQIMSDDQPIELEGTVATVLPGTMFRVTLDNQHQVLAHLSGKMRKEVSGWGESSPISQVAFTAVEQPSVETA